MANYAILKAAIQDVIKTNGNNEITGQLLQNSLVAMINSLGVGYQYVGIATPTTNPGTPDQNVFYLASTAGTYTNFGGLVLEDGEIAILKYNGSWSKEVTGAATAEQVTELGQKVDDISESSGNIIQLQNKSTSVNSVDVVTYRTGRITVTGTASSSGGRTIKLCTPFPLPAGTYTLVLTKTPQASIFLQKESGNTIVQTGAGVFTLDAETNVYIGINLLSGTTYNDDFGIAIYSGQSSNAFLPTLMAIDAFARNRIDELVGLYNPFVYTDDAVYNRVIKRLFLDVSGYTGSYDISQLFVGRIERAQDGIHGIRIVNGSGNVIGDFYRPAVGKEPDCIEMTVNGIYCYAEYIWENMSYGNLIGAKKITNLAYSNNTLRQILIEQGTTRTVYTRVSEANRVIKKAFLDLSGYTGDKSLSGIYIDILISGTNNCGFRIKNANGDVIITDWTRTDKPNIITNVQDGIYYYFVFDWSKMPSDSDRINNIPFDDYIFNTENDIRSSIKTTQISNDAVTEEKLSPEVRAKLNSVSPSSKNCILYYNTTVDAESYIESDFDSNNKLRTYFVVRRSASIPVYAGALGQNNCFNLLRVVLVNKSSSAETTVHGATDDICPGNYNGGYIGGNHGVDATRVIKVTGHGKTAQDVGSKWTIGNISGYTIIGIVDQDHLRVLGVNTATYPKFLFQRTGLTQGAVAVHESGATHTGSFTLEENAIYDAASQWHSAMRLPDTKIFVDGKEITETGSYAGDEITISENYDVVNPAAFLEYLQDNVGNNIALPMPNDAPASIDNVVRHCNTYRFTSAAHFTLACDFIAYQDINIGYFGYIQQYALPNSNRRMYIPKSLPVNDGGNTIDFRLVPLYSSLGTAVHLTTEYWENPNSAPDRYLQFNDAIGLHSGYLFDYGVGGENRKNNINDAFFLNTSMKCYPHGIDNKITVSAGDHYGAVVWRTMLDRNKLYSNGIISTNVFEYNERLYIYGDWNAAGVFEISIPDKYIGGEITIFEKSSNVELLNDISSHTILVKVGQDTVMYGYLVASISK